MTATASSTKRIGPCLAVAAVICGAAAGFGCSSSSAGKTGAAGAGGAAGAVGGAGGAAGAVGDAGGSGGAPASGGAGGAGEAGASGAAGALAGSSGTDGGCPTAAPFDDSNAAMVAACTVPVAVAVGNALRRAVTHDGMTWDHDVSMPDTGADQNENSHRDALVARGLIFVVGDGGLLLSRDGGDTFTVARAGRYHDSALAYFQGTIWAISNIGTFSTTDGTTWKEYSGTTMLPGNLPGEFGATGVAAVVGGSRLLVLSGRATSVRLFDGTTWTQHAFDTTTYGQLKSAAFANDRFVILGEACCDKTALAGLRATSPDGVAWTAVSNATAGAAPTIRFSSVVGLGTSFFATASQYDKRTYTSTDGLAWNVQTSNFAIGPVTFSEGAYLGTNGALIYRSTDGVAWSLVHTGVGNVTWGYSAVKAGRVLRP